jgi:hypothetical protein
VPSSADDAGGTRGVGGPVMGGPAQGRPAGSCRIERGSRPEAAVRAVPLATPWPVDLAVTADVKEQWRLVRFVWTRPDLDREMPCSYSTRAGS